MDIYLNQNIYMHILSHRKESTYSTTNVLDIQSKTQSALHLTVDFHIECVPYSQECIVAPYSSQLIVHNLVVARHPQRISALALLFDRKKNIRLDT